MKLAIAKDELDFAQKTTLNKNFWKDEKLNPEVRDAIMAVVESFLESTNLELGIDDIDEIEFTGSLANYNYSKFSDVDIHLLFDFSKLGKDPDFMRELLTSKAIIWNNKHNVTLFGHEVELYITAAGTDHHSTGVYSVKDDKWLVKPVRDPKLSAELNLNKVKDKADKFSKQIDMLVIKDDLSLEIIEKLKDKIKKMRIAGLETGGEFSIENLAFKLLRRRGELNTLSSLMQQAKDEELSLEEDMEWWKKRRHIDNKNYRELMGYVGEKGVFKRKYAAKNIGYPKSVSRRKLSKLGAPYTMNPPMKLPKSGPPGVGALEEQTDSKIKVGSVIDFNKALTALDQGYEALMILKGRKMGSVIDNFQCLNQHDYFIRKKEGFEADDRYIISFNADPKNLDKKLKSIGHSDVIGKFSLFPDFDLKKCLIYDGEEREISYSLLKDIVDDEISLNNLLGFKILRKPVKGDTEVLSVDDAADIKLPLVRGKNYYIMVDGKVVGSKPYTFIKNVDNQNFIFGDKETNSTFLVKLSKEQLTEFYTPINKEVYVVRKRGEGEDLLALLLGNSIINKDKIALKFKDGNVIFLNLNNKNIEVIDKDKYSPRPRFIKTESDDTFYIINLKDNKIDGLFSRIGYYEGKPDEMEIRKQAPGEKEKFFKVTDDFQIFNFDDTMTDVIFLKDIETDSLIPLPLLKINQEGDVLTYALLDKETFNIKEPEIKTVNLNFEQQKIVGVDEWSNMDPSPLDPGYVDDETAEEPREEPKKPEEKPEEEPEEDTESEQYDTNRLLMDGLEKSENNKDKIVLVLGNSQSFHTGRIAAEKLKNEYGFGKILRATNRVGTKGSRATDWAPGGSKHSAFKKFLNSDDPGAKLQEQKLKNKNNIGAIVLCFGDASTTSRKIDGFMEYIRGQVPNAPIFWFGPPPIVSGRNRRRKNNRRNNTSNAISSKLRKYENVKYINVMNMFLNNLKGAKKYYKDYVHVNDNGARFILAGKELPPATKGASTKKSDKGVKAPKGYSREQNIAIIKYISRREGIDPEMMLKIANIESKFDNTSGWDGRVYKGLWQIGSPFKKEFIENAGYKWSDGDQFNPVKSTLAIIRSFKRKISITYRKALVKQIKDIDTLEKVLKQVKEVDGVNLIDAQKYRNNLAKGKRTFQGIFEKSIKEVMKEANYEKIPRDLMWMVYSLHQQGPGAVPRLAASKVTENKYDKFTSRGLYSNAINNMYKIYNLKNVIITNPENGKTTPLVGSTSKIGSKLGVSKGKASKLIAKQTFGKPYQDQIMTRIEFANHWQNTMNRKTDVVQSYEKYTDANSVNIGNENTFDISKHYNDKEFAKNRGVDIDAKKMDIPGK